MVGEYKKILYGSKEVLAFFPYTLNELYITSKKNNKIDEVIGAIESVFPLDNPANKFFLDLLLDQEMLYSYRLSGIDQTFADIYAENPFNIFRQELKDMKAIYEYAVTHINKLSYSNRFLKDLHHALYNKNKRFYPGEFRKVVSFVGETVDDASYIAPPIDSMQDNMDEMELFMYRDDISVYIRASLLYYQIMSNLPFLIGNQEIGRLTSILYLIEFGGVPHYIPLSKYLENVEYYRLEAIKKGDINIFLIKYLEAIRDALKDAKRSIRSYNNLKQKQAAIIDKSAHTIYQKRRLHEILRRSHRYIYLQSEMLSKEFQVLNKTIVKRYRFLIELGILKTKRTYFSKQYYNHALLRILTWLTYI